MDPSVAVCSPSRAVKKEAFIQPCFSWQTQPPPAHWSMTCTQEAGLYKILSVGSEGVGGLGCTLLLSLLCSWSAGLGKQHPSVGRGWTHRPAGAQIWASPLSSSKRSVGR